MPPPPKSSHLARAARAARQLEPSILAEAQLHAGLHAGRVAGGRAACCAARRPDVHRQGGPPAGRHGGEGEVCMCVCVCVGKQGRRLPPLRASEEQGRCVSKTDFLTPFHAFSRLLRAPSRRRSSSPLRGRGATQPWTRCPCCPTAPRRVSRECVGRRSPSASAACARQRVFFGRRARRLASPLPLVAALVPRLLAHIRSPRSNLQLRRRPPPPPPHPTMRPRRRAARRRPRSTWSAPASGWRWRL